MKIEWSKLMTCVCIASAALAFTVAAQAEGTEVKEKPAIYTYEASWDIPRAKWGDMDKDTAATSKALDKALAAGNIVVYGNETSIVHTTDGGTHFTWWESPTMAGLLTTLEQLSAGGGNTGAVLASATKHWDEIFVTHYYNWKSGAFKNGFARAASYSLKETAPDDAVDTLAKVTLVPFFEKLLADGTLVGYEIDEQALHTSAPGKFWIYYVATNAAAVDKVNAALMDRSKSNPLVGPAFDSFVNFKDHRDSLSSISGVAK